MKREEAYVGQKVRVSETGKEGKIAQLGATRLCQIDTVDRGNPFSRTVYDFEELEPVGNTNNGREKIGKDYKHKCVARR